MQKSINLCWAAASDSPPHVQMFQIISCCRKKKIIKIQQLLIEIHQSELKQTELGRFGSPLMLQGLLF